VALIKVVDPISTIADGAASGAFFGATAAFLLDQRGRMADWLLIGTVYGGAGGIGRVMAGF
jgi:hypothetical protein